MERRRRKLLPDYEPWLILQNSNLSRGMELPSIPALICHGCSHLSRHVTDDVTDVLSKNFGKTDLVTLSRLKRGAASSGLLRDLPTHCRAPFPYLP